LGVSPLSLPKKKERGRVENRREEKGKARGRRRTREFNNPKV
jgi:hypothetical protein